MPTRRKILGAISALATAPALASSEVNGRPRIGMCAFSCHQHWQAVRQKAPGTKFADAPGFYDYARTLGAEGVQTSTAALSEEQARAFGEHVAATGGYYEADLRLPQDASGIALFEREVKLARAAGATVARAVLQGGRRYEVFKTMAQFQEFLANSPKRLALAEPIVRKHRLKLAIENHKDLTVEEITALIRRMDSEWIGVLVDTGNNIALLDEPHAAVEALAPLALSVHLKDMAVQQDANGFLLSEIACGDGFLDLPRIVATLRKANPAIVFNLEMATRDPLKVPCLTPGYWTTFPDREATHLAPALDLVKSHPATHPPPTVSGEPLGDVLRKEESNNRSSLGWMRAHIT